MLKLFGQGHSTEGFDADKGFAYQMVPQSGMPRIVYFETDHSDWIMARNEDLVNGAPVSGTTAPFQVEAIKRTALPEDLGGRWPTYRLPAKSQFAMAFTGRGTHGHFEFKIQPVKKHVKPMRFRISALPPVQVTYSVCVLQADPVKMLAIDHDKMVREFERMEEAYKLQANVDMVRVANGDVKDAIHYVRVPWPLGDPIVLSAHWKKIKQSLDKFWEKLPAGSQKVVICWNVLTGLKKKTNEWIDDALGVSYGPTQKICFCETELGDVNAGFYPEWTTIAHELGHSMALKHTTKPHNVMMDGSMGAGVSNRFLWFQIEKLNGTFADRLQSSWFD